MTMKVTPGALELTYKGFKAVFQGAFEGAPSQAETVAMTVKSQTSEEFYAWLGQFPALREWIGDRIVKQLSAHGYTLTNRKFESTVSVKRDDFEDERWGIYKPMFAEMGRVARNHPDTLLFDLLRRGFSAACYDGGPFFSDVHPRSGTLGDVVTMSNMLAGTEPAWYLLDTSRAIKPLIWQERTPYEFQAITDPNNYRVFMTDDFTYGIRARANAGFGLWQLAFGSKAELTPANYAAARRTMMGYVGDEDQLLGVMPTHIVVPPVLEEAGRALINSEQIEGTSNPWKGSASLVVSPWLR